GHAMARFRLGLTAVTVLRTARPPPSPPLFPYTTLLRSFPLTLRQVMVILTGTGVTGGPGIATGVALLLTAGMWVRWPLAAVVARSEERRVGKECRSRWWPYQ